MPGRGSAVPHHWISPSCVAISIPPSRPSSRGQAAVLRTRAPPSSRGPSRWRWRRRGKEGGARGRIRAPSSTHSSSSDTFYSCLRGSTAGLKYQLLTSRIAVAGSTSPLVTRRNAGAYWPWVPRLAPMSRPTRSLPGAPSSQSIPNRKTISPFPCPSRSRRSEAPRRRHTARIADVQLDLADHQRSIRTLMPSPVGVKVPSMSHNM
jgi:hypothetical protein